MADEDTGREYRRQAALRAGNRAASGAETVIRGARKAQRGTAGFAGKVTRRRVSHHVLMVEYLLFTLVVLIRAAADYVPGSGASKGAVTPPSGQYGPLPVWATGTGVFFILSFPAAKGGTAAKFANAFGALVVLGLLMKSTSELDTVAKWYENITSVPSSPAGTVLPTPTGAVPTIDQLLGIGGSSSSPGAPAPGGSTKPQPAWKPVPGTDGGEYYPIHGKCPPGYTLSPNGLRCIATMAPGPPLS